MLDFFLMKMEDEQVNTLKGGEIERIEESERREWMKVRREWKSVSVSFLWLPSSELLFFFLNFFTLLSHRFFYWIPFTLTFIFLSLFLLSCYFSPLFSFNFSVILLFSSYFWDGKPDKSERKKYLAAKKGDREGQRKMRRKIKWWTEDVLRKMPSAQLQVHESSFTKNWNPNQPTSLTSTRQREISFNHFLLTISLSLSFWFLSSPLPDESIHVKFSSIFPECDSHVIL